MKKTIIEVLKTNKKAIIKKTLILTGTAIGLVIATSVVRGRNSEENEDFENVDFTEATETSDAN